jgi:hypothetical protein
MTIDFAELRSALQNTDLPGGEITIERHESAICDMALHAEVDREVAHPMWFVIASLRTMGITVEDLCRMAAQEPSDTLLFGECRIDQTSSLSVGATYRSAARITDVSTRTMRDGSRLDSVTVEVSIGLVDPGDAGTIASTYLFRRGIAA